MTTERDHIANAAACLGDRMARREPVFFSEKVDAAIAGKPVGEAVAALADLIQEAQADKAAGFGPPQSDIIAAMRRYQKLYEAWAAERLPSTARKDAA